MKCLFSECETELDYLGWCSDECNIKSYHESKCKVCEHKKV